MKMVFTWIKWAVALLVCALASAPAADSALRLAVTTSTENSGLLDYLLPDFERQCHCAVRVIPVGSGKALALGRNGDIDVLLTHAPADEKQFIADGFGVDRRDVMRNDFVFVGPPTDPADLRAATNIDEVMNKLARGTKSFISRGDDSGTHKKELLLWQSADISPIGDWYIKAGAGMGQALLMAHELRAYTLSDRGTYLAFRDKIDSRIVVEVLPPLHNPYSVMRINPQKHPHTRAALARQFIAWLTSPTIQKRISAYRYYGEPLFVPAHTD